LAKIGDLDHARFVRRNRATWRKKVKREAEQDCEKEEFPGSHSKSVGEAVSFPFIRSKIREANSFAYRKFFPRLTQGVAPSAL
jgi:hypothetical protein